MARVTTWRCDRCSHAQNATPDDRPMGWTLLAIGSANAMDLCQGCGEALDRWVSERPLARAPTRTLASNAVDVDEVAELLRVPAHRKMYRALAERSPAKVVLVELAQEFGQRPRASGAFLSCLRVAAATKGVPITSLIRTERVQVKGHNNGLTSAWVPA